MTSNMKPQAGGQVKLLTIVVSLIALSISSAAFSIQETTVPVPVIIKSDEGCDVVDYNNTDMKLLCKTTVANIKTSQPKSTTVNIKDFDVDIKYPKLKHGDYYHIGLGSTIINVTNTTFWIVIWDDGTDKLEAWLQQSPNLAGSNPPSRVYWKNYSTTDNIRDSDTSGISAIYLNNSLASDINDTLIVMNTTHLIIFNASADNPNGERLSTYITIKTDTNKIHYSMEGTGEGNAPWGYIAWSMKGSTDSPVFYDSLFCSDDDGTDHSQFANSSYDIDANGVNASRPFCAVYNQSNNVTSFAYGFSFNSTSLNANQYQYVSGVLSRWDHRWSFSSGRIFLFEEFSNTGWPGINKSAYVEWNPATVSILNSDGTYRGYHGNKPWEGFNYVIETTVSDTANWSINSTDTSRMGFNRESFMVKGWSSPPSICHTTDLAVNYTNYTDVSHGVAYGVNYTTFMVEQNSTDEMDYFIATTGDCNAAAGGGGVTLTCTADPWVIRNATDADTEYTSSTISCTASSSTDIAIVIGNYTDSFMWANQTSWTAVSAFTFFLTTNHTSSEKLSREFTVNVTTDSATEQYNAWSVIVNFPTMYPNPKESFCELNQGEQQCASWRGSILSHSSMAISALDYVLTDDATEFNTVRNFLVNTIAPIVVNTTHFRPTTITFTAEEAARAFDLLANDLNDSDFITAWENLDGFRFNLSMSSNFTGLTNNAGVDYFHGAHMAVALMSIPTYTFPSPHHYKSTESVKLGTDHLCVSDSFVQDNWASNESRLGMCQTPNGFGICSLYWSYYADSLGMWAPAFTHWNGTNFLDYCPLAKSFYTGNTKFSSPTGHQVAYVSQAIVRYTWGDCIMHLLDATERNYMQQHVNDAQANDLSYDDREYGAFQGNSEHLYAECYVFEMNRSGITPTERPSPSFINNSDALQVLASGHDYNDTWVSLYTHGKDERTEDLREQTHQLGWNRWTKVEYEGDNKEIKTRQSLYGAISEESHNVYSFSNHTGGPRAGVLSTKGENAEITHPAFVTSSLVDRGILFVNAIMENVSEIYGISYTGPDITQRETVDLNMENELNQSRTLALIGDNMFVFDDFESADPRDYTQHVQLQSTGLANTTYSNSTPTDVIYNVSVTSNATIQLGIAGISQSMGLLSYYDNQTGSSNISVYVNGISACQYKLNIAAPTSITSWCGGVNSSYFIVGVNNITLEITEAGDFAAFGGTAGRPALLIFTNGLMNGTVAVDGTDYDWRNPIWEVSTVVNTSGRTLTWNTTNDYGQDVRRQYVMSPLANITITKRWGDGLSEIAEGEVDYPSAEFSWYNKAVHRSVLYSYSVFGGEALHTETDISAGGTQALKIDNGTFVLFGGVGDGTTHQATDAITTNARVWIVENISGMNQWVGLDVQNLTYDGTVRLGSNNTFPKFYMRYYGDNRTIVADGTNDTYACVDVTCNAVGTTVTRDGVTLSNPGNWSCASASVLCINFGFNSESEYNITQGGNVSGNITIHSPLGWASSRVGFPGSPVGTGITYYERMLINWTDTNGTATTYNVSLINSDLTFNQTLNGSIPAATTEYYFDTELLPDGFFRIAIAGCSAPGACSVVNMTMSEDFRIDNRQNTTFAIAATLIGVSMIAVSAFRARRYRGR